MQDAFTIIRQDLGPDAVIISSKKIRENGLIGLFSAKKLEVTAAVDETRQEKQTEDVRADHPGGLEREVAEMKKLLNKLTNSSYQEPQPQTLGRWRELLLQMEISNEVVGQLLQGIGDSGQAGSQQIFGQLTEKMITILEKDCSRDSKIITFVGPTGVGKTTTMAKLAAQFSLYLNKKVALITIDTYRIGAVEQLRTYGEIMGIPIDVVMTPKELKHIVDKHRDKDLVLIDTAGRPSKSSAQIRELKGFLEQIEVGETCLVLSSTTRGRDLLKIVEDFRIVGYDSLIFTKVDETEILGPIVDIVSRTDVPVRYITNGQNVPDDIEEATPEKLAKLILGAAHDA